MQADATNQILWSLCHQIAKHISNTCRIFSKSHLEK